MNPATIDVGAPLTPHDIIAVARSGAQVTVGDDAMERVKRASDLVESLPTTLPLITGSPRASAR